MNFKTANSIFWLIVLPCLTAVALAQNISVETKISAVTAPASFERKLSGANRSFTIKKGDSLQPGDVIDTTAGGRVVLALSDGSQAIIHPGSRVLLKDFRHANSARELMEIFSGRVRFKIYHLGKRPNPYRVNSPAASIAVRGTEFLVSAEPNGETQVVVYEGAVEVSSRVNPRRRALLGAGDSVIVRPGGNISLALPGPGGELNSVARLDFGRIDPANEIFGSFQQQYFDRLAHLSNEPEARPFSAFADSHFDSLENPAYATEFNRAEGRLYLLPSFSESREFMRLSNPSRVQPIHPFDNTLAQQLSFFTPIDGSPFVIGGAVSTARTNLQGRQAGGPLGDFSPDLNVFRTTSLTTTTLASFVVARRFGDTGRNGFGIKLDYLAGRGSLVNVDEYRRKEFTRMFRADLAAEIDRFRLTIGLSRDFGGGKKLGLFFREGNTASVYSHLDRGTDDINDNLERLREGGEQHAARISELGVRWRDSLTRRLFYGLEGLVSRERFNTNNFVQYWPLGRKDSSTGQGKITRSLASASVGYAPNQKTFVSVDATVGVYRESSGGKTSPGVVFGRSHFMSLHSGLQYDLWRGAFVSSSFLKTAKWHSIEAFRFDRPGIVTQRSYPAEIRYFNNYGIGWRLKPNLAAQYLISTSYGNTSASHTLMLRYHFSFDPEK
ncbi:MAG: FecR domain-containing protein [Acidobacteriota bacterium]|nr:FecR domain-containing protein [Acidobacteriota bacterium]